jgi:hypothetical protein
MQLHPSHHKVTAAFAFLPAALLFAASLAAQNPPAGAGAIIEQFNFAGGVQLRIGRDSMTDRKLCVAQTPMTRGVTISFMGKAVFVNLALDVQADYYQPAVLRLGDAKPFQLIIPQRPHVLFIPLSRAASVVRALYSHQRIRLRFIEWPDGRVNDGDLALGDFASAYDTAVRLCRWLPLRIAAIHPNVDSAGMKDTSDLSQADQTFFPLEGGWTVSGKTDGTCDLDFGLSSNFGHFDGRQFVASPSRFMDDGGRLLRELGREPSFEALLSAAAAAGSSGLVEFDGEAYSLLGFSQALTFLRSACAAPSSSSSLEPGYVEMVRRDLSRNLRSLVLGSLPISCSAVLTISRDGEILDFRVEKPDGDQLCISAIRVSNPLPSPGTAHWNRNSAQFRITFSSD